MWRIKVGEASTSTASRRKPIGDLGVLSTSDRRRSGERFKRHNQQCNKPAQPLALVLLYFKKIWIFSHLKWSHEVTMKEILNWPLKQKSASWLAHAVSACLFGALGSWINWCYCFFRFFNFCRRAMYLNRVHTCWTAKEFFDDGLDLLQVCSRCITINKSFANFQLVPKLWPSKVNTSRIFGCCANKFLGMKKWALKIETFIFLIRISKQTWENLNDGFCGWPIRDRIAWLHRAQSFRNSAWQWSGSFHSSAEESFINICYKLFNGVSSSRQWTRLVFNVSTVNPLRCPENSSSSGRCQFVCEILGFESSCNCFCFLEFSSGAFNDKLSLSKTKSNLWCQQKYQYHEFRCAQE